MERWKTDSKLSSRPTGAATGGSGGSDSTLAMLLMLSLNRLATSAMEQGETFPTGWLGEEDEEGAVVVTVFAKEDGSWRCSCVGATVHTGLDVGEKKDGWAVAEGVEEGEGEDLAVVPTSPKLVAAEMLSEATESRSWMESKSCMLSSGDVTLVGGEGSQRNWTKSCSDGLDMLARLSISMSSRMLSGRPSTEDDRRMSGLRSDCSPSGDEDP